MNKIWKRKKKWTRGRTEPGDFMLKIMRDLEKTMHNRFNEWFKRDATPYKPPVVYTTEKGFEDWKRVIEQGIPYK